MKQAFFTLIMMTSCTAGLAVGPTPAHYGPPGYVVAPAGPPPTEIEAAPGEPPPISAPVEHREAPPTAVDSRIPPGQWTLQEKEYWIKLQDELDEFVSRANAACGSNITGRFVHDSFRGRFTAGGNYGLDLNTRALCGASSNALVEVCNGGATAKQAVASKVHQIVCEYGPARYGIAGGVFRTSINTEPTTLDTHYNAMLAVIRKSL